MTDDAHLWYLRLVVCLLWAQAVAGGYRGFHRVCYFTGWSLKREDPSVRPSLEDLDPFLCTHIIFAFAKINVDEARIEAVDWDDESTPRITGNFEKLNALKRRNPELKIMLSIGGAKAGSYAFDLLVNHPEGIWAFAQNAVDYLRKWKFNGLDLDWEYPGLPERGTTEETKYLFTELLRELHKTFRNEARATGRSPLLLSVAVGVAEKHVTGAYEPRKLAQYADFLNVMAYDFHGGWDRFTGGNSPLYARSSSPYKFLQSLSQEWAIKRWLYAGVPAEKLVLGISAQGRTFTLANTSYTTVGADARGHGNPGPFTNVKGVLSLFEVLTPVVRVPDIYGMSKSISYLQMPCRHSSPGHQQICRLVANGATRHWDGEQMFPYAVMANQWVGYDNPRSVALKADWASRMRLGGVMLWSLDLDDFSGDFCEAGKYPLAKALKKTLKDKVVYTRTPTVKHRSGVSNKECSVTWIVCVSFVSVFISMLYRKYI